MTATVPRETIASTEPTGAGIELGERILHVPVDQIDVGDNVRTEVGDLAELTASIAELGILQPIRIREAGERYSVVYGQRRLLAARAAGLVRIPAVLDLSLYEDDRRTVEQLVENVQRRDLNPLEEARALKALADQGLTHEAIAQRIGRSRPYVSNLIGLLDVDPKVQELVAGGSLSTSHAKALAALPDGEQRQLANDAARWGWTSDEIERQAQWKKEEATRSEKHARQGAKRGESSLGWLRKHKVPEDAVLFIDEDQHATLAKAGYRNLRKRYGSRSFEKRDGYCDCIAWESWYDGQWRPVCASAKHNHAWHRDAKAKDLERRKPGLEALALGRQTVSDTVVGRVDPLSPFLLLWAVLRESYNWSDYARELGKRLVGKELTSATDTDVLWTMVRGIPDEQIFSELGAAVAAKILPDLTGLDGDWRGRSHQAIRRTLVEELRLDPQLIDGKAPAKPARKAKAVADA